MQEIFRKNIKAIIRPDDWRYDISVMLAGWKLFRAVLLLINNIPQVTPYARCASTVMPKPFSHTYLTNSVAL